ncbi:Outer-membrane lipoprotein LolB [Thalassocella blandensis]|nr:Outer-membrane lipoprotein LolB [Thalassocella blandensis]
MLIKSKRRYHTFVRTFSLILATYLLSACTNMPTYPPKTPEQLLAQTHWQAKGKIGVRQDGKAHSANFDWENKQQQYTIRIAGALGVGSAKLVKKGAQISLTTKHDTIQANSAEQLLEQTLGWSMPVSHLSYWIKGLAAPTTSADNIAIGDMGELIQLEQEGWKISYSDYAAVKGYWLPGKIRAQHGDIKITLIVKSWKI